MRFSRPPGGAEHTSVRSGDHPFTRDPETGVYFAAGDKPEFAYSDGDEAETRILNILRQAGDVRTGSPELTAGCSDFVSQYHLNPRRANLLRPLLRHLQGRVLVAGAGCGAEARLLGESGAEVWAVEGSSRRAEICAERCRDLPNVSVFCAPIQEFRPEVCFDAVTLIGVLEYSPVFLSGPDAPLRLLRACRGFLRESGVLVLAIENLLGLKYFAGAPEDHIGIPFANMNGNRKPDQPITFGKADLSSLLESAGLPSYEFLYPYPDYKFPRAILRESAFKALGEAAGEIISSAASGPGSSSYDRIFSEEMCWRAVVRNGLGGELANSFLVAARPESGDGTEEKNLAYIFAESRRRPYAKETVIQRSEGGVVVRRAKLYPSSPSVDGPYRQELRDEVFLRGRELLRGFTEIVNRQGWDERDVAAWGRPWFEMLADAAIDTAPCFSFDTLIPGGLIDCVPSNLMILGNGSLEAFDQEWSASEPVALAFVVFRGLFGAFAHLGSIEAPGPTVPLRISHLCQRVMLEWKLPLTTEQLELVARRECAFQEAVTGITVSADAYLTASLPAIRDSSVTSGVSGREMAGAVRQGHRVLAEVMAAHRYEIAKRDDLVHYFQRHEQELVQVFSDALRRLPPMGGGGTTGRTTTGPEAAKVRQDAAQTEARNTDLEKKMKRVTAEAEVRLAALSAEAHRAVQETATLRVNLQSEQLQSAETAALANSLQAEIRRLREALKREQAAVENEAAHARFYRHEAQTRAEVCREVIEGVELFRNRFRQELNSHRNQRAWQVMLAIRKLYSLLLRKGWTGRRQLPGWCVDILRGKDWGLAAYDLAFPDPGQHLPRRLWLSASLPEEMAPTAPAASNEKKYDVAIFPVFEFDFRYQRPQQLARQFAAAGHRVFWISPSRISHQRDYEAIPIQRNLFEVRLPCPIPNLYSGQWTEPTVSSVLMALGLLFRDQAVSECVSILQLPFWRQIGGGLKQNHGVKVVYDCIDHWDSFPELGEFTRSEEPKLAAAADVLIVTARSLFDKHAGRGLSPSLVRNGADFDFFRSAGQPADLGGIQGPVIGYFGAIADWFDFDLVRRAALERPSYSFVLLGGLGLEEKVAGREVDKIARLPNIHLLGHKSYEQMPAYLKSFDVCTIPFRLNEVTMATDPVKLYEYLSQGKPVVTTGMREIEPFSELIYFARSDDEFIAHLDAAVSEPVGVLQRKRTEFAAANSWRSRYEAIHEVVSASFELVSILIVTHNSAEFIRPCLDSILRNTSYPRYEVIVVDNASTDGTADLLNEYAQRENRITVVLSPKNDGFARGNNRAARHAAGEYLVFLNADTMVTPGWIGKLLNAVRCDPSIGQAGPVTNWAGNEMRIDVSYTRAQQMEEFSVALARERRGELMDVDVAPLFCALSPKAVWRQVGELDETFGIGMFEDDDYSLRVRQAGLRVVSVEDCFVHHFGQGSFNQLDRTEYTQLFEENKRRFEEKWGRAWTAHRYRPSCSGNGGQFTPAEFCRPDGRTAETSSAAAD